MTLEDKNSPEFLSLLAFLVKMDHGSLMDRTPESILAEVEKVDSAGYVDTLDEIQKKRYNAYIEFHKINQTTGKDLDMGRRQLKEKGNKMSDEQETTAPAETAEATPAETAAPAEEAKAEGSEEAAA
jgi:hypothetical protein